MEPTPDPDARIGVGVVVGGGCVDGVIVVPFVNDDDDDVVVVEVLLLFDWFDVDEDVGGENRFIELLLVKICDLWFNDEWWWWAS